MRANNNTGINNNNNNNKHPNIMSVTERRVEEREREGERGREREREGERGRERGGRGRGDTDIVGERGSVSEWR
jgi:hypothetical protein